MCPERAAPGHGQGEDADLPHHVQGVPGLCDVHLQTGGDEGSVPGNHAGAGGQHRGELGAVHELRILPAVRQLPGREAQGGGPQVGPVLVFPAEPTGLGGGRLPIVQFELLKAYVMVNRKF